MSVEWIWTWIIVAEYNRSAGNRRLYAVAVGMACFDWTHTLLRLIGWASA